MNWSKFSSLDAEEAKVYFYLVYVRLGKWEFDLSKYLKDTKTDLPTFMQRLNNLEESEAIELTVQYGKLLLLIENGHIDLKYDTWTTSQKKTFMQEVLQTEAVIVAFLDLINDGQELKEVPTKQVRKEPQKEYPYKSMVIYFYGKLNELYQIKLAAGTQRKEINMMKSLVKQYPTVTPGQLKEGINWLLSHHYWSDKILNVKALKTHLIKYLAQNKTNKTKGVTML